MTIKMKVRWNKNNNQKFNQKKSNKRNINKMLNSKSLI